MYTDEKFQEVADKFNAKFPDCTPATADEIKRVYIELLESKQ